MYQKSTKVRKTHPVNVGLNLIQLPMPVFCSALWFHGEQQHQLLHQSAVHARYSTLSINQSTDYCFINVGSCDVDGKEPAVHARHSVHRLYPPLRVQHCYEQGNTFNQSINRLLFYDCRVL